jgi:hypothetical protein
MGTLEKSISKLFQKSSVLWWDTFSYYYMSDCLLGKASIWENFNLRVIQKSETLI